MCHIVALPFTLKKYLKAKEESWKLKYFTMPKHNLQKILKVRLLCGFKNKFKIKVLLNLKINQ
jgi:hypothetical protein